MGCDGWVFPLKFVIDKITGKLIRGPKNIGPPNGNVLQATSLPRTPHRYFIF